MMKKNTMNTLCSLPVLFHDDLLFLFAGKLNNVQNVQECDANEV